MIPVTARVGKSAAAAATASSERMLAAVLRTQAEELERRLDDVRRTGAPKAVHRARVASRRLRSHLRTYRSLLPREAIPGIREALAATAAALGPVRDRDVLAGRLRERAQELPDAEDRALAERLLDRLATERAAHLDEARRIVDLPELVARRGDLAPLLAHVEALPATASAQGVLRPLARKRWSRLRRAVGSLDEKPSDAALHRVRLRAKHARYAAESLRALDPSASDEFVAALTAVQEALGQNQDAAVARAWLLAAAQECGAAQVAFVAGELAALEAGAADGHRADWHDAWRAASRRRLRRWLG